jgi:hypothetical protein
LALDALITQQAQIIAYIGDYKVLMLATLAVLPFIPLFKRAASSSHAAVSGFDRYERLIGPSDRSSRLR